MYSEETVELDQFFLGIARFATQSLKQKRLLFTKMMRSAAYVAQSPWDRAGELDVNKVSPRFRVLRVSCRKTALCDAYTN